MVTFYVANNLDEAAHAEIYMNLPEALHSFLYDEFKSIKELELITQLSFYGEVVVFNRNEINMLKELREIFKGYKGRNKGRIQTFFMQLQELCNKAIEEDKLIVTIAD